MRTLRWLLVLFGLVVLALAVLDAWRRVLERHETPIALRINYDSLQVHRVLWPARNAPICTQCLPDSMDASLPCDSLIPTLRAGCRP